MTIVQLYQDDGFKGDTDVWHTDDANLLNNFFLDGFRPTTWNDQVSSLKIFGGSVTFYRDIFMEGPGVTLGPGSYNLHALQAHGIKNDWISSFDIL